MTTYYPLGRSEGISEGEYQAMSDAELVVPPDCLDEAAGYWRTRDGRVLRVREMSRAHLQNAISLFTRAGWGNEPKLCELRAELQARM
jgi:hypothetical protein